MTKGGRRTVPSALRNCEPWTTMPRARVKAMRCTLCVAARGLSRRLGSTSDCYQPWPNGKTGMRRAALLLVVCLMRQGWGRSAGAVTHQEEPLGSGSSCGHEFQSASHAGKTPVSGACPLFSKRLVMVARPWRKG
jgi:hypothetical protein